VDAGQVRLVSLWGSGPNDVWAVGSVMQHWDGISWSTLRSPFGARGVWGSGPNDVWAVDQGGGILHWNGTAWSPSSSGASSLSAIWGSGPKDVWAVGAGGTLLHHGN
jgi:hypothetical protein